MSKLKKTFFIIFMIIILFTNFYIVKATDDEDFEADAISNIEDTTSSLDSDKDSNLETNNTQNENVIKENASDGSLETLSPSSITSVSNKNNYSNANLELNNILCIILISIGVLLILFAIAILIRLNK